MARFTIYDLKYQVEQRGSLFFTRNNMKHAGDTMANFGMVSVKVKKHTGETVEAFHVYRKKRTKRGLLGSFYFEKETFRYLGTGVCLEVVDD
jgi:hypothetical protein